MERWKLVCEGPVIQSRLRHKPSELCDFGADPDVQFDLVRESELSSNDEENSASCAMAKVLTLGLIGCYWWLCGMESFNH